MGGMSYLLRVIRCDAEVLVANDHSHLALPSLAPKSMEMGAKPLNGLPFEESGRNIASNHYGIVENQFTGLIVAPDASSRWKGSCTAEQPSEHPKSLLPPEHLVDRHTCSVNAGDEYGDLKSTSGWSGAESGVEIGQCGITP